MGAGDQSIAVTLRAIARARSVPFLGFWPTQVGVKIRGSGKFIVVWLHFKNTGAALYHSRVANWSWLTLGRRDATTNVPAAASDNADPHNENANYGDLQGVDHTGRMELRPGKGADWFVAFPVGRTASPVACAYQGPGNKNATWTLPQT